MSAMGDLFEAKLQRIETAARSLIGHVDEKVHAVGEEVVRILGELKGDVPVLESEVAKDAADVVHTAETEGVVPAEHEAIADAAALGAEAVHDVESAATAPAQTAAVIAGEAAVASEPGA